MAHLLTHMLLNARRNNPDYFPQTYKLLPHEGPLQINGRRATIPSISLAESRFNDRYAREALAKEVIGAAETCGMFQVVDHGISADVIRDAMTESTRFFDLPSQQINAFSAPVAGQRLLYTSSMANHAGIETHHFWRDALTLSFNSPQPTEAWPSQPPNFTRAVWEFATNVKSVEARLLDLICQGLVGLEPNYFGSKGYNASSAIVVNRYPRCPQPTWAYGMAPHGDPNLLTISIQGGANGLQIWQDDEWKLVVPSSNALLVTVGHQMEIVTRTILKAPEHRVVVNSECARTSLSLFTGPTDGCIVESAPNLPVDSPYRSFQYREFIEMHLQTNRNPSSILPHFFSWS